MANSRTLHLWQSAMMGFVCLFLLLLPTPLFAQSDPHGTNAESSVAAANPDEEGRELDIEQAIKVPPGYAELRNSRFSFTFPENGRARAEELLERAINRRQELSAILGVDPPDIIHVFLAGNSKDFALLQPRQAKVPSWVAGIAWPDWNAIILREQGSQGQVIELERTFDHELAHALFRRAIGPADVPRWFHEGLAQWLAREFDLQRIQRIWQATLTGRLIPMKELTEAFPSDPDEIHLAYDQSFEFVNFLIHEFSEQNFHDFVRSLNSGGRFVDSLELAYGMSLAELERRWVKSLRLEYNWIPLLASGATVWTVASVLFLLGYVRRRRDKTRRLAAMEKEERADSDTLDRSSRHAFSIPVIHVLPPDEEIRTPSEDDEDGEEPKRWLH